MPKITQGIIAILTKYSDSWTFTKKSESGMNASERKVLRRTLGPTKENNTWRIRYNELYKQFEETSIQIFIN
jgi:hypothetical protein